MCEKYSYLFLISDVRFVLKSSCVIMMISNKHMNELSRQFLKAPNWGIQLIY